MKTLFFLLPFSVLYQTMEYYSILNTTVEYAKTLLEGENDIPDLSWFNVAIASLFILVNGKYSSEIAMICLHNPAHKL